MLLFGQRHPPPDLPRLSQRRHCAIHRQLPHPKATIPLCPQESDGSRAHVSGARQGLSCVWLRHQAGSSGCRRGRAGCLPPRLSQCRPSPDTWRTAASARGVQALRNLPMSCPCHTSRMCKRQQGPGAPPSPSRPGWLGQEPDPGSEPGLPQLLSCVHTWASGEGAKAGHCPRQPVLWGAVCPSCDPAPT